MRHQGQPECSPDERRAEILEILRMWSAIESSYDRFSAEERKQVDLGIEVDSSPRRIAPFGRPPRYIGFSASEESESEHFSAAIDLIDEMDELDRFKGRELHPGVQSGLRCLDAYRRMLVEYSSVSRTRASGELSVADVIALLTAAIHPDYRS